MYKFIVCIIALLLIRTENKPRNAVRTNALKELQDGLVFVKNHRSVLVLISIVGVVSLFGMSYVILMPVFANDILKVGIKGLAKLMSCAGAGAVIGALILARLGNFRRKGRFLVASAFIFSFALILFALSRVYWFSLLTLVFLGGSTVTAVALINTLLQIKVPDEFRGRVMSVFMLTFAGFLPFGNLISGAVAQAFGVSLAVCLSGIVCGLFFTLLVIFYPQVKDL